MPTRVAVTEPVPAAAERVYALLADYRVGHPSILPSKYFHGLVVEEGGVGDGTVIRFQMTALGKTRTVRGIVSEPEPGRKLVESYPESGMVTSFILSPLTGGSCELTIATEWQPRGLAGLFERLVIPPLLRKIYRAEIGNIVCAVTSQGPVASSPGGSRKDIGLLPPIGSPADRWNVAEADYGGSPLLVRTSVTAAEWCGHPSLGIKLGFAVPLNAPNLGGLPVPQESRQLNEIEDVIVETVAVNAKGVYALTLTTGEMREFVFYIASGADIGSMHEAIRRRVSTHDVQCQAVTDPIWDAYTQFAPE